MRAFRTITALIAVISLFAIPACWDDGAEDDNLVDTGFAVGIDNGGTHDECLTELDGFQFRICDYDATLDDPNTPEIDEFAALCMAGDTLVTYTDVVVDQNNGNLTSINQFNGDESDTGIEPNGYYPFGSSGIQVESDPDKEYLVVVTALAAQGPPTVKLPNSDYGVIGPFTVTIGQNTQWSARVDCTPSQDGTFDLVGFVNLAPSPSYVYPKSFLVPCEQEEYCAEIVNLDNGWLAVDWEIWDWNSPPGCRDDALIDCEVIYSQHNEWVAGSGEFIVDCMQFTLPYAGDFGTGTKTTDVFGTGGYFTSEVHAIDPLAGTLGYCYDGQNPVSEVTYDPVTLDTASLDTATGQSLTSVIGITGKALVARVAAARDGAGQLTRVAYYNEQGAYALADGTYFNAGLQATVQLVDAIGNPTQETRYLGVQSLGLMSYAAILDYQMFGDGIQGNLLPLADTLSAARMNGDVLEIVAETQWAIEPGDFSTIALLDSGLYEQTFRAGALKREVRGITSVNADIVKGTGVSAIDPDRTSFTWFGNDCSEMVTKLDWACAINNGFLDKSCDEDPFAECMPVACVNAGPAAPGVSCGAIFDPVCALDGVTLYSNPCVAASYGVAASAANCDCVP